MSIVKNILFLFFILSTALGNAQTYAKNSIDVEFQSGYVSGQTSEYVFEGDKCISRLDWDENFCPYIGIIFKLNVYNILFDLGITNLIPEKSGKMRDYDFLISGSNDISHFSEHDAYLDKHFTADAGVGYVFRISEILIVPLFGYEYQNRKWSAQDGYLQYPVDGSAWTGAEPAQGVSGTVISYEQMFYSPRIGVELILNSKGVLSIALEFYVLPSLHVETMDSHFLRLKQFYDVMDEGVAYKAGGGIIYHPSSNAENLFYKLQLSYEHYSAMKGTTSSGDIGISDGSLTNDDGYGAGMEAKLWDVSFSMILKTNLID